MADLTTAPPFLVDAFNNIVAVLAGTGPHADHTREQIGRCVVCSCGERVQGRMAGPSAASPAGLPVFEVVLADGFVSYRCNDRAQAEQRARDRDGATVRQVGAA